MFISFEGIDLSGKSTQLALLHQWLQAENQACLLVREPGGTTLSERIRSLLLDAAHADMSPIAEMLLFSAARAQLVSRVIQPALADGIHVLADRFSDSTLAYQGYGRGLNVEELRHVQNLATGHLEPDLTLYFDLDYEESQRRRIDRSGGADRIEASDSAFYEKVRAGYHDLAQRYSHRFVILDASLTVEQVFEHVMAIVSRRLQSSASS